MTQRIAVLASGPSLPAHWDPASAAQYDTVIAVNSANHIAESDWTVCMDVDIVDQHVLETIKRPKIGYVSTKRWKHDLGTTGKQYREIPGRFVGCHWSFPNALFFARSLQREKSCQIDVYGFDCALDVPDCANLASNHSEKRFTMELIWIKPAWNLLPTRVFSDIKPEIVFWLNGKTNKLEL